MTIMRHVTEYWLRSMREIAATIHSLKADGSVIPPEIYRLHRACIRNFAGCSISTTHVTFEDACDFASDTARRNNRAVAVVAVTRTWPDGRQDRQYAVHPAKEPLSGPGYIKLETLTTFYGTAA